MSTQAAEAAIEPGNLETELRRAERFSLAMPARCRTLGGFVEDVVIRDLSSSGCRIAASALTVQPGAKVIVRPSGIEGLCGTVRWIQAREAGIEFDQPLYQPVVEHLHRLFQSFLGSRSGPPPAVRRLAA